jgi:hypothetical protein
LTVLSVNLSTALPKQDTEGTNYWRIEGRYIYVLSGSPSIPVFFEVTFKGEQEVRGIPISRNVGDLGGAKSIAYNLQQWRAIDMEMEFVRIKLGTNGLTSSSPIVLLISKVPQPIVQSV